MDSRVKTILANSLQKTGLLRIAERTAVSEHPVIFMLHRVLPKEEIANFYNPYLAITPESFEGFLTFLSGHFTVETLTDLLAECRPKPGRRRRCALTFDDGWEDNYRVAWPILRRFGMPATIFVTTGMVGTSDLLPEDKLWQSWRVANARAELSTFDHVVREYCGSRREVAGTGFFLYRGVLKQLPREVRFQLLADLEDKFGNSYLTSSSPFMNWDQLRDLSNDGILLGSHTVTHPSLACEQRVVIREELSESKKILQQQTGKIIDSLAYPSGLFDERVIVEASQLGYKSAVTTSLGAVRANSNNLLLPRMGIDNSLVNDSIGRFSPARTRLYIFCSSALG